MNLVTPGEMESIDRATIEQYGLPSLVLMENAARSVLPHLPPGPVCLLIGPGNNGGDGLVIARALHETGRSVRALLFSKKLSPDAQVQRELAYRWGVPCQASFGEEAPDPQFSPGEVVVDALFGTGLSRALSGRYARVLDLANRSEAFRLAIDIPSGVDGATGQILGTSLQAHCTVTFGLPKWGHVLHPGKQRCGRLVLTQPGFSPQELTRHDRVRLLTPELVRELLPREWPAMHKGDNGRVLLVTGSEAYPGAGVLATLGALRGGGGLVTQAAGPELRSALLATAPEALLVPREPLPDLSSYQALVLGSGLGPDTERFGPELLQSFRGPVVVDADALQLVARTPAPLRGSWVLTPHPGELARLLGCSVQELEKDRIASALKAAEKLAAVVCFKGSPTVCASPQGRALVNSTGGPALAQGGSGDVLAGLMGSYLAYGLPPWEAAAAAVYVHGLAGDLLAQDGCPRGAGARAVAERIPQAFGLAIGKDSVSGVL